MKTVFGRLLPLLVPFAALLPAGFVPAATTPPPPRLRVVTYNIDVSDTDSITAPPGMYTILKAIGDMHLSGHAQPIDVLSLTELDSYPWRTLGPMCDELNKIYGAGTYAYDPYVGDVSAIGHANGPNGLIYNTKTVKDIAALGFGRVSGTYAPRQPIRYQLRPVGYGSNADFYVYVDHYKANADSEQRRLYEAEDVRANADALGPHAHIIYTGDFNLRYASDEWSYQKLISAGNAQAVDPVNPNHDWDNSNTYRGLFTESAQNLFGRYDLILPTNASVNENGVQYLPGTYTVFGNNGTTHTGDATNLSTNTALGEFSNRTQLLDLLTTVSDHMPVVADYAIAGVSQIPEPASAAVLLILAPAALARRRRSA